MTPLLPRSAAFRFGSIGLVLIPLLCSSAVWSQPDDAVDFAAEEAKQAAIARRFAGILEKNPRRGTAFDRVYGFHVEFGSLEKYVSELRERAKEEENKGAASMILGLIEAHRGQDASAVDAFRVAEAQRPDDPLPAYYLGQSLLLIGQPQEAVEALERAIECKPERADLLEIYQQLGRMHQRAQRDDEALKVWARLEAQFPNDPRVLEQIAVAQVDEGKFAEALPRYERLVELVKDDYRKTTYRMEVAALKIRSNNRGGGLADLETLLGDLNPDGWLHREVRRRIEEVFLRSGDQDGLVKYYQGWLEKHPQDVNGMARLARFLASTARVPEAGEWLEKALTLAPKRSELRRAFISQLLEDQRYTEAVQQYALLAQASPGDADVLREWGRVVLKDKSVEQTARVAEAKRIWSGILETRPDDALTTSQVADLFRQSNLNDEATALYEKAVTQAPGDPQYREYLGEFYHVQKQPEKALETWKQIAAGDRKSALNLSRLAEVLSTFGYAQDSTSYIAEAAALDPKDLSLQVRAADYHARAEMYDKALEYNTTAAALMANDDEREQVLKQKISVLQSARRLEEETEKLAEALHADANATAEQWLTLARYYEADRKWSDASETIAIALQKSPQSTLALTAAARIAELSGDFQKAADLFRQLAASDRRARGDYLMNVARLESQLGRSDQALEAGRELIVSAPGNTAHYEFYAQLCFRLGKMDEGLETLRKAVRINPGEPHLITALAAALAEQFKADEAIQVYWQAFEKSESLDDKTVLIMRLTDLHLQLNQFERLIERLDRDRSEEEQRRMMTICIAQAHQSAGDVGTARTELESLLSQETRDTELLLQLSKLCEQGRDFDAAIDYQRQIVAIAPGHETEFRMASLLQSGGDIEGATEILVKLTQREEDPARLLRSIDSLLTASSFQAVIAVTEPLLRDNRDNWELIYREGVAWASLNKKDEARDRFQRILAMQLPHDTLGVRATAQFKQAQAKAKSANLMGASVQAPQRPSPLQTSQNGSQVRQAVGIDYDRYSYSSGTPRTWAPDTIAQARMACIGWELKFAQAEGEEDRYVESIMKAAQEEGAPRETIYDELYLRNLQNNYKEVFQIARRLAESGGPEEEAFFLQSLSRRTYDPTGMVSSRNARQQPQQPPMAEADVDLMLKCYTALRERAAKAKASSSTGVTYQYVGNQYIQLASSSANVSVVARELRWAGRDELANQLVDEQLQVAETVPQIVGAISLCTSEKLPDRVPALIDRWKQAALDDLAREPKSAVANPRQQLRSPLSQSYNVLAQWMGQLAEQKNHPEILHVLDVASEIGVQEAKIRRSSRKTSRSSNTRSSTYIYYWYGTRQQGLQLAYPAPSEHFDQSQLTLLRQAFEVFRRNDVLSDLTDHLKKQAETAPPDDLFHRQLAYGYTLWWQDEQDEAVAIISNAAALVPDDLEFRLELALLHQQRNDFDAALAIVDSIVPRDQKLLQTRETLALQLAERLGETDRARAAAERLFGLRLDADSQLALAATMKRLGLQDMAEAITARVQKRSGNSPSALLTLMLQYQGQGRMDLAEQLAHSILQRSPRPNASMAAMIASGRMSSGDSAPRIQALKLLHQTGALKKLVERTETQLAAAPKAAPLYEQLIEYYGAANDRDKVRELLLAAVEQRPDSPELRVLLATQLQQSGKTAEACDQYAILLKQNPELISDNFYQVQNIFQQAGREGDLGKAMLEVDLKRFRQPYYAINVVTSLLSKEATREHGIQLFERCFNEFPNYRGQLIGNLHDDSALKDPRVFDLVCKCLIPSDAQVVSEPWYGFNQITSYSGSGQANGMIDRLLSGSKGSEQARNLRTLVAKRLETAPGWNGGRAMIAVLDIHEGNREAGVAAIQEIFPADAKLEDIPMEAMWLVAQQIDQDASSRDLAIKLFEQAMKRNERGLEFQYGPGMRLVKLYQDRGEKDLARTVLLSALKPDGQESMNDPSYQAYQQLRTEMSVANALLKAEFPADALRVYRNMVNHPERIELGSRVYGTDAAQQAEQQTRQARSGLTAALSALKKVNIDEAITQLLQVDEQAANPRFRLDLLLIVPDQKQLAAAIIRTPLSELFTTLADSEAARTSFVRHLSSLREKFPDDLSIAILAALWSQRLPGDDFARDVASLLEIVRRNPLEPLPEGTRPNARQRTEAARWLGLWLVARECSAPELIPARAELGGIARDAAARQLDRNATTAILYDWGKLALKAGDRSQTEQMWTELLDSATVRPKASPKPAAASGQPAPLPPVPRGLAAGAPPIPFPAAAVSPPGQRTQSVRPAAADDKSKIAIPPLTISQFRIAILVARSAATNKFAALSQKAVREALSGGMPVPDAPTATNSMSGMVVRTTRPGQAGDAEDPLLSEVATAIRQVVDKWTPEEFPPGDVYDLLEPIVFPASRPGEILLYPDHSGLRRNVVSNLGIQIVEWADRAGRTSDLQKQIDARRPSPPAAIAAAVLDCEQALLKKDYPAAAAALKELDRLTTGVPSQTAIQLAAHVAIRAFKVKELKADAAPLLKRALLASLPAQPNNGSEQNMVLGPLSSQLNRYFANSGNTEAIREFYESFATARQQQYANYSGDYGAYQLWNTWIQIANDAAENGTIDISLDYLGRSSDTSFENYGRPSIKNALATISLSLAARSASDRYIQLRDWTLPAPPRETIRVVIDTVSPSVPPQAILDLTERTGDISVVPLTESGPLSNVMQLIDAAEACGSLPELCERLQPLREKKVAFADSLLALALIRAGRTDEAAPIVDELFKTRAERSKVKENSLRESISWVDYIVWREMLNSPAFSTRAIQEFPEFSQFAYGSNLDAYRRIVSDFARHQRRADNRPDSIASPEFVHWLPASASWSQADNALSWWTVSEGQIARLGGPNSNMLSLRYPIEGNFQFEIDLPQGNSDQSALSYGGMTFSHYGSHLAIYSIAGHEQIKRSRTAQSGRIDTNQIRLQVASGRMTWFLNGHEIYTEDLAAGSPWLHLFATPAIFGTFRNLRISGEPRIPREVSLLGESSMEGWMTSFLGESQPALRKANEQPGTTYDAFGEQVALVEETQQQYHWSVKDGVLNGQNLGEEAKSGWTYYHRPLDAGESVQFEFFHASGEQTAAPTFGRFAFLLEPDGVRTRWINRPGWDDSVLGVPTENAIQEAAFARTDGPLPLKANEWNTVAIAATKETVSLSLNGTLIFERPIEADNPRMVGIYRPKDTKTQVRKIVLSGNWPEKIEGDLLALVQPLPPEERRLQSRLLDDDVSASRSIEIVLRAREQDDATAYETLRGWVLPSDDHADIRIAYRRVPVAPAAPIPGLSGKSAEGERICPAWELVQVAGRLNRLDELRQAVSTLTPETVIGDPARREALLVLIDVARQDDSAAIERLAEIEKVREKNRPAGELDWQRAPEVMAISIASQRPGPVATAADELARAFRKQARGDKQANANWLATTEVLAGLTGLQGAAASGSALELRQWSSIPVVSATARANGLRPGEWSATRGEVVYRPGESLSQLVYRSPITGRFQVHGTLSTGLRDEMLIGYGHFAARPGGPDLKNTLLYRLPVNSSRVGSELTIPGFGESARFRVEVDGSRIATFVNDVRIHEQRADPAPSPWLVLQPSLASSAGRVSDLRITGEPRVPETVNLLQDSESAMWTADYFGGSARLGTQSTSSQQDPFASNSSEQPAWVRQADELIGNLAINRAEKSLQSIIYYRRPLLEDGELDYEMFYVPGEFEIHPAVGRTVVQITPERIARHILTDGELDRSGLAPDNSAPIEGAVPGATLKPNDWNQVKLRLKGDELTVLVNDAEAARLTLTEPPSQRFFGLFRYADQQKSRVRNFSLRGDWPKSISSPNEQELAAPDQPKAARAEDNSPAARPAS